MRSYSIFLFVIFHLFALQSNSQVYNPISYAYNGTPTNGIKIKTNLPYCNGCQMPTIIFERYNYGGQAPIGLTLTYYIYDDIFWYRKVSSWGAYTPVIKLAIEDNKVIIFIDDRGYYQRFNIRVYAKGLSEDPSWFTGWLIVDEQITGSNIAQAEYQNNFSGVVNFPGGGYWNSNGLNVQGKVEIANRPLDNTAFLTTFTIDGNTNDESANNSFNVSKPSIGLVFRRDWSSMGTPKALGGIYAWGAYNWAGGLAFTTTPAYANGVQSTRMVITDIGNIGIGTTSPGEFKLNVNGTIRANEVVVNTSGADFVFDKNYKLSNLFEVEKYITENKHLPGIDPAMNMQREGVNLSEMQTKLLQKIEELTLYSIEQNKRIEELNNQIKKLKEIINGLQ